MCLFHLHSYYRRTCELSSPSKCNQKLLHLWTEFAPAYLFSCKYPHEKAQFQGHGDHPHGLQVPGVTRVTPNQADNQVDCTIEREARGDLQHLVPPSDAQQLCKAGSHCEDEHPQQTHHQVKRCLDVLDLVPCIPEVVGQ